MGATCQSAAAPAEHGGFAVPMEHTQYTHAREALEIGFVELVPLACTDKARMGTANLATIFAGLSYFAPARMSKNGLSKCKRRACCFGRG